MYRSKLIKFGASFCNPCNEAQKYLEKNFDKKLFASVDVTINEDLAKEYNIKSIPTFILFNAEGEVVDRFIGLDTEKIDRSIKEIE